jgi:hypothetical protein
MAMEKFVHEQNLAHYRRLLASKAHVAQRQQILLLLAEEEAKDLEPPSHETPQALASAF